MTHNNVLPITKYIIFFSIYNFLFKRKKCLGRLLQMNHYQKQKEKTIIEKQYILGRREIVSGGTLLVGRYYAIDGSLGANVYIDMLHPHVILICGKRGYGKSYTIGVFLEELGRLKDSLRKNLGVVVLDTLGIFWTLQYKNSTVIENTQQSLYTPQEFPLILFVPKKNIKEYKQKGIQAHIFSLQASELSPSHWCYLFNIKPTDPFGIILTKTVLSLQELHQSYSLSDIVSSIQNDESNDDMIKNAAKNFFIMAQSWDIFHTEGISLKNFVIRGAITILDISCFPNQELKDIITSLIAIKIFEERVKERKIHELKKIGFQVEEKGMPMVWLAIDEAQIFLPNTKATLSKDVLINDWMRQGRQPGLSLIMATQRPSALEPEVLSHSDLIFCHRLTAQEDIDMLSLIRPIYMYGDIKESLKKIGEEKGVALLIDDTSEAVHIIKIRPRCSWHGGAESLVAEG